MPTAPVVDGGAVVEAVVPDEPVVAVVPVVADVGPVGVVVAVVETTKQNYYNIILGLTNSIIRNNYRSN